MSRLAMLREDQIRRYARHVLLPDVGGRGQERLLAASVSIELGPGRAAEAAALAYLAAAGVGRLILIGDARGPLTADEIATGILYGAADRGRPRGEVARERALAINPDVEVVPVGTAGLPLDTLHLADELYGVFARGSIDEPGSDLANRLAAPPLRGGDALADAMARAGAAASRLLLRIARRTSP